jgi:hypothetical protein
VEAWRKRQGKRTRIPEELWDAAVETARVDGVWATAQATRFNFRRLQQLARARYPHGHHARAGAESAASAGPAFVELSMDTVGGTSGGARTVIDMVGRHGDRMRVEVGSGVDVIGIVHTFWSGQSCCS